MYLWTWTIPPFWPIAEYCLYVGLIAEIPYIGAQCLPQHTVRDSVLQAESVAFTRRTFFPISHI